MIQVIDLRSERMSALEGHSGRCAVTSVGFGSKKLVTCTDGAKETLARWAREVPEYFGAVTRVQCLAIGSDWFVAGVGKTVTAFDVKKTRFELEVQSAPERIAISPNGKHIAVVGGETLWVIDVATQAVAWSASAGQNMGLRVAWSGDGRSLVVTGHSPSLRVYTADGEVIATLLHESLANADVVPFGQGVLAAGSKLFRIEPAKQKWASSPSPCVGHLAVGFDLIAIADEDAKTVSVLEVSECDWSSLAWVSGTPMRPAKVDAARRG